MQLGRARGQARGGREWGAADGRLGERMTQPGITIDGTSLRCAQVASVARGEARVQVGAAARAAAGAAWQVAQEVARQRPVYGRTTGVGAKRNVTVTASEAPEHGLHVLRSHAAGTGPLLAPELGGPCWWSG